MRLPLHIKTTIFASAAILIVMILTFGLFAGTVVNRLQKDQMDFAEAQAENLTEKISDLLPSDDFDKILKTVTIFNNARINRDEKDVIRVWETNDQSFLKRITTAETEQNVGFDSEVQRDLLAGEEVKVRENFDGVLVYRVFVPLRSGNKQTIGAVEFAEQLDTFTSLAKRYLTTGIILALVFVGMTALAIYQMTGFFVYRPLRKLTQAMRFAKKGNLESRAAVSGKNEFGAVADEFNSMLAEIEEFSKERERQNEVLEEKVVEATAQLRRKNSQLERANAEIWQATSRLSDYEKLAAAGQTAAQFAHEVGTPLNLISGHVQLLLMQNSDDEAVRKRLDLINSQIERIEKIVRSMLDKTRFGEVEFTKISLNEILANTIEIVAPHLDAEEIKLSADLAEDLPRVEGNAERLMQVFLNLINNAKDAVGKSGEITLRTFSGEKEITVEISDNGAGMDGETKKRIFEPLFTTKGRGQGTGLGLVVVRQILTEHHAQIAVESEKGEGTVFRMIFPSAGQ
ncbi:MAG: ATP-binding protein [Pyrinomonadaceae bacterium]